MDTSNRHVLYRVGHFYMLFMPFVASITLTFSCKRLYLFLTEGHHPDSDTMLLSMVKCAAFAVPVSTLLVQMISFGYVLFIGTLLTTLGLTLPLFIADAHTQEATFVVLYGSGTSVMFQASFPAVSAVFRANIVSSILILSLSSVIMASTRQLLDYAILLFPRQVLLGLLVFLAIMCLFPAVADILQTSRLHINETTDADAVWPVKSKSAQQDSERDTLKVSLAVGKSNSAANTKHETIWAFCAILCWAVGVHLSCFITSDKEVSTNISIVSLVCLVSLAAFVVNLLLTERMAAYFTDGSPRSDAGYFILGLLGIASLLLTFYPKVADVHCYVLLFVISLFHQLKKDVSGKIPNGYRNPAKIISQCCTELILTLCAMITGYFLSYTIYYKTVPPGLSCHFSDISLSVLATVMILVSLRCSFKGTKSSLATTAPSVSPA